MDERQPLVPGLPRPLQTAGRSREADVEQQIGVLLSLSSAELKRRAQTPDRAAAGFVKEETLVYMLREKARGGDMHTAGDLAELLVKRCSPFVHKHIAAWKLRSSSHAEECAFDVFSRLMQDLFDLGAGSEFWEVRFWVCLKRRILNCVQKYQSVDRHEFQPDPLDDGKGRQTDVMETWADTRRLTPQERMEIREALALLPDKERLTFVLWHYEEWTQEEIARHLQISDRAVRYRLERAEERLAAWRAGHS
ncbi:MAG TPA: sigma-70 family RNA polymerase sigma factor [Chthonomonadaceae bacterium]|nr:sigma-70 family RNA polymerase sigma factor [Chthonomonadaceae bacterium]